MTLREMANDRIAYLNTWDEETQKRIKKWCVFYPKTENLYAKCDTYEEALKKALEISEVTNND